MMTVIAEPPFQLSTEANCLRFEQNGKLTRRIPFNQMDCLILKGKVNLGADVLQKASSAQIPVLVTGGRSNAKATWVISSQSPSVMLRIAQHRTALDAGQCLSMARLIIQAKFNSYRLAVTGVNALFADKHHCARFNTQLSRSTSAVKEAESLDTLRGCEGFVARSWFDLLAKQVAPGWNFKERNRRPPRDPFNALISLTHTILEGDVHNAVAVRGFDPTVGFLHSPLAGRLSLALDLLEPIRPLAETFVLSLSKRPLTPGHFYQTGSGGWRLQKAGWPIYMKALTDWRQQPSVTLYGGDSTEPDETRALWPSVALPERLEHISEVCTHLVNQCASNVLKCAQIRED